MIVKTEENSNTKSVILNKMHDYQLDYFTELAKSKQQSYKEKNKIIKKELMKLNKINNDLTEEIKEIGYKYKQLKESNDQKIDNLLKIL